MLAGNHRYFLCQEPKEHKLIIYDLMAKDGEERV